MSPGGRSDAVALGPGAEFDRIRRIAGVLGGRARGLGDDCALLTDGDHTLALSTDISVEGIHFRLDWISLEESGWRSAAAALSDLAAEGAEAVVGLGVIPDARGVLEPGGVAAGGQAGGGADIGAIRQRAGVPVADLAQDGLDYFDLHHTPNDTLDKIERLRRGN